MSFVDSEAGGSTPSQQPAKVTDQTQAFAGGNFQIKTSVSTFKRLVNFLGTTKDTPGLRKKLHNTRQRIGQLAKDNAARLKSAIGVDQSIDVSASKKVEDAKLAKDFQAVLTEFQKAQKIAAERENAYAPFVPPAVQSLSSAGNDLEVQHEDSPETRLLLIEQRRQDLLQPENEVLVNEALIEERDQGIREIQQQISEVNEIFKDLAVVVNERRFMYDDIENLHSATTQPNSHLKKAVSNQKFSNSLTCLLLIIFAALLLIIIIIVIAA